MVCVAWFMWDKLSLPSVLPLEVVEEEEDTFGKGELAAASVGRHSPSPD